MIIRLKVNGKTLCELEPIEATQWLNEDELFYYADKCHSLIAPFQPALDHVNNFIENGKALRDHSQLVMPDWMDTVLEYSLEVLSCIFGGI
ncbi:hypothetical protein [Fictibacillus sp. JL2B1089]|uniref:hypothetical protein n=1 Tax=Fictibacillus sp. JL2B1089 TaxID=3399565 RepID=UPI003A86BA09